MSAIHSSTSHSRRVLAQEETPTDQNRSRGHRLLLAVSVGAVAAMLPGAFGVYGGRARAQVLPAGCTDAVTLGTPNDADGNADAGETIACLAPPTPIEAVQGNTEDLTIVVGDASTPTSIAASGGDIIGVNLTNGGTVQVLNAASTVYGEYNGVYLGNTAAPSVDLELVSEGTITSDLLAGVAARNVGSSTTSITVVDVTSNNSVGIEASTAVAAEDITIVSTGTVMGGTDGIQVNANGLGATRISAAYVTGANGDGINAVNQATATDLTITTTGLVQGQVDGIEAYQQGTGALIVNAYEVSGITGYGVYAHNTSAAIGDVSVTVSGRVNVSSSAGISAINRGSGNVYVNSNGLSSSGIGINASNTSASGADLTVVASGSISGYGAGIQAAQSGAGNLVVNTYAVTGLGGAGSYAISASTAAGSGALSITTNESTYGGTSRVYGGVGISASHAGSGDLTINTTSVSSNYADAIEVTTASGSAGNIAITASGLITGTDSGVDVDHDGSGDIALDLTGVIANNTTLDIGVRVIDTASGGSISVTSSEAVDGGFSGIQVAHFGSGGTTIDVNGASGTLLDAISTYNFGGIGGMSITSTGDLVGGDDGVSARNDAGDLTIDVGNVTAGTCSVCNAIDVDTQVGGYTPGFVAVSLSGAAYGGRGVRIDHDGTGDVTVTLGTGSTATGVNDQGIYVNATNAASNTVVQGSSGDIVGATDGVYMATAGGDITIQSIDSITGQAGDGVDVRSNGGDITISDVGTILGADGSGIYANSDGGDISIQGVGLVGGVEGTTINGIFASASSGAGGIVDIGGTTAIGDVSGATSGITTTTSGDGAITISVAGSITAGSSNGVFASNRGTGDTTISVADVTSTDSVGVFAYNDATAADMHVTSTGTLAGAEGVVAIQDGAGDLVISVLNVTGTDDDGITALHRGTGSIEITSTGVLSGGDDGIELEHAGGGDVTVQVADLSGGAALGDYGMIALTAPTTGSVSITSSGSVTGGSGVDIYHRGTGPLDISVADVTTSASNGVYAISSSALTGDITVSASGTVAAVGEGIYLIHAGVGDVVVDAVDASGQGDDAIDLEHVGTGSVRVTTTGTITGTDDGIDAIVNDGDLTITTSGTVTGGQAGIEAYNYSAGSTTISVSDDVTGETEVGIFVVTSNGSSVSIEEGATVTGAWDGVVFLGETGTSDSGADILNLAAGASIVGDALMHAGDDTFNDAGGQFTGVDGGTGTDTLNVSGPARTLTNSGGSSDSLRGFEIVNVNTGGITLAGDHVGFSEANFNEGTTILAGTLEASSAMVMVGATLNAQDGTLLTGNLTNNGTLDVGSSPGTFTIDGDLTLSSTSLLPIELGDTSDQIVVTGDVTLGGTLDATFPNGRQVGTSSFVIIDGGGSVSGSFDQVPASGLLVQSDVDVDPSTSDVIFTSTVLLPSTLDGLSDNQAELGDSLFLSSDGSSANQATGLLAEAIGQKESEGEIAAVLQDLSPEAADMGIRMMLDAQNGFHQAMLAAGTGGRYAVWGDIEAGRLDQNDNDDGDLEFDGGRLSFFSGMTMTFQSGWSFGFAGGVTGFDAEADDAFAGLAPGDDADGELFHVGGSVRKVTNNDLVGLQFDAGVSYAGGSQDITMTLIDPVTDGRARQSAEVDLSATDLSARVMLIRLGQRDLSLQPFVEGGASFYQQDGFTIGQAQPTGLAVDDLDNTRTFVRLGSELDHALKPSLSVQGRVAAVQYFGDTQNTFDTRFLSSNAAAFSVDGRDVETQVELAGAIAYRHASGVEFRVEANGEVGDIARYGGEFQILKRF
ncbi:MAG: autotransporter outer membrane beta-barrel domain-containing protein [Pseudomonadota bacterium]